MKEFNDLKEKYSRLFDRLLDEYKFYYAYGDEYHFQSDDGKHMKIDIHDDTILVIKKSDDTNSIEAIELPNEENRFIKCVETVEEVKDKGIKVDEVIRFYGITNYSDDEYYLIDLYQTTRCADKDYQSICNRFECHMNSTFNMTRYNCRDISYLYKDVDGPLKVEKIFDLYNGNITKLLDEDLINSKGFNYKKTNGIKDMEEQFFEKDKVYKKI